MPKDKLYTLSEKQLFVIYNHGSTDLQRSVKRKTGINYFMPIKGLPKRLARAISDARTMKFNDRQSPLLHPKK